MIKSKHWSTRFFDLVVDKSMLETANVDEGVKLDVLDGSGLFCHAVSTGKRYQGKLLVDAEPIGSFCPFFALVYRDRGGDDHQWKRNG